MTVPLKTLEPPDIIAGQSLGAAPGSACRAAVSKILLEAINGTDKSMRTEDGRYIRWGRVERKIHETISVHWPNKPLEGGSMGDGA